MPVIKWDNSFSIKIPDLDEQHKSWIHIINELHDALMSAVDLEKVSRDTIDAMIEYARNHFAFEEAFMTDIGFPEYAKHKKIHQEFQIKLELLENDITAGTVVLNRTIMKELTIWLTQHILKEDKKIAAYATANGTT